MSVELDARGQHAAVAEAKHSLAAAGAACSSWLQTQTIEERERESGSACELVSILCLYSLLQFYSRPRIALAIAVDCYSLLVLFIFRLQIFRRPWTDFRETLSHDIVFS